MVEAMSPEVRIVNGPISVTIYHTFELSVNNGYVAVINEQLFMCKHKRTKVLEYDAIL